MERPHIAFFDYPDVFEDFYPHYGVDQQAFATDWAATGNHAFLSVIQREIGDVTWYALSLAPQIEEARHRMGFSVRFLPSSALHRRLWRAFYLSPHNWRWRHQQRANDAYALFASYLALCSRPLLTALLRDRPDALFVQDYGSGRYDVLLLMARALGVPLIAYHSGSVPEHYVGRIAKRWTVGRADWLIASSEDELERLSRVYHVPRERLRVVLTPIDTASFHPCDRVDACTALGLDPARRYLLFVGRLDDEVKRVGAIIRQFAALSSRFPQVDLLIAGDGPDVMRLRDLAAQLIPGRVHFRGWVSGSDALRPLYNAADALLLPSRSEGFPTVVGEALSCGAPVLASRVGGIPEVVVQGRTGWLVPPGDDRALNRAMAEIMEHPARAAAMRESARGTAEARLAPGAIASALRPCFPPARSAGV